MARALIALSTLWWSGCFVDDPLPIPDDARRFTPEASGPEGWLVRDTEVDLRCPDGALTRLTLVYPEASPEPRAVAVLFHAGAFDYVLDPDPAAPLAGPHFAAPPRLSLAWALRQVYATLGMHPILDARERQTGALPAALADEGIAMLLPANCWGDLWGARSGGSDSVVEADFFRREGRTVAEWAVEALLDEDFADLVGLSLPFAVDPDRVFLVGLGSGGRGVLEVVAGGARPPAILLDSSPDDLQIYLDAPVAAAAERQGLARIFRDPPAGIARGAVHEAPWLPEHVVYAYSVEDPVVPAELHDRAVERLDDQPGAIVLAAESPVHVQLNGANPDLTAQAVVQLAKRASLR